MKALLIVCVLAGVARAEMVIVDPQPEPAEPAEPPTHTRLFGWRIGGGMVPGRDIELQTMSLGLSVEHRVHGRWRIAGEYEYVWLGVSGDMSKPTSYDGGGHRANLAIRRTMLQSRRVLRGALRFYADVELGGGMMLASEPMTGTITLPQAFAGLRLGYTFIKLNRNTRASPVWEPELILRAIGTKHDAPLGYFFGIGLNWGD